MTDLSILNSVKKEEDDDDDDDCQFGCPLVEFLLLSLSLSSLYISNGINYVTVKKNTTM